MEHYEPGRTPNIGREGIYLPPSTLKENKVLLFVAFEPIPANLQAPLIRPEPNSIRKEAKVVLELAPSSRQRKLCMEAAACVADCIMIATVPSGSLRPGEGTVAPEC